MRNWAFWGIFLYSLTTSASDWPAGLVQKTYDGCLRSGGQSQCRCVVHRLQYQFTFEDVKLAMSKRIANQALQQAIKTYTMKCLEADFKRETENLFAHLQ